MIEHDDGPGSRGMVALAGEQGYARPMAVALASLVAHTPIPLDVVVIDAGLSNQGRQMLLEAARPWPLRFETLPEAWLEGLPQNRLPLATYSRLYLSEFAPDHCRRILYLDGDVLVRESVLPLLDLDLDGNIIAAVGDQWSTHFGMDTASANIPGWREAGIPASGLVFNSGVMVIDREAWDKHSVTDRVLAVARNPIGRTLWADQAFLNLVLWREWLPADGRWNSRRADAAIAHFAGPYKPWSAPAIPSPLYVEYQEVAARLGWDIPGRSRLRARVWARRVARAALPPVILDRRGQRRNKDAG